MKCRILDITRTISRVGAGHPTGIDRVERAYINAYLEMFPHAIFLAKLSNGYFALAPDDMARFVSANFGNTLNTGIGLKDLVRLKLSLPRRRAQSFIRKNAIWSFDDNRSLKSESYFPESFDYTNVGHSNLTNGFLSDLKSKGCEDIRVMIHDMIPLDFPEYCQPKTPNGFLLKMQAVATYADEVICNSQHTKSRVETYFADWINNVSYVVAPLGVEPHFQQIENPKMLPTQFTILGTIEPRKNHQLLLDVWTKLSKELSNSEMPILNIVGKRGWENKSFFDQLDASPLLGRKIIEYSGLNDFNLNELLNNSTALLFPSFTEGYGLPALEALALEVPVICSDIPVFKELLGSNVHMLPSDNVELWSSKILEILKETPKWIISERKNLKNFTIPTWSAHFRHVFQEYRSE